MNKTNSVRLKKSRFITDLECEKRKNIFGIFTSDLFRQKLSKDKQIVLIQKFMRRHVIEKKYFQVERIGEFDFVYCDFRPKTVVIMMEEEW